MLARALFLSLTLAGSALRIQQKSKGDAEKNEGTFRLDGGLKSYLGLEGCPWTNNACSCYLGGFSGTAASCVNFVSANDLPVGSVPKNVGGGWANNQEFITAALQLGHYGINTCLSNFWGSDASTQYEFSAYIDCLKANGIVSPSIAIPNGIGEGAWKLRLCTASKDALQYVQSGLYKIDEGRPPFSICASAPVSGTAVAKFVPYCRSTSATCEGIGECGVQTGSGTLVGSAANFAACQTLMTSTPAHCNNVPALGGNAMKSGFNLYDTVLKKCWCSVIPKTLSAGGISGNSGSPRTYLIDQFRVGCTY